MEKTWIKKFMEEHGPRIIYIISALLFGFIFLIFFPETLGEAGKTVLIGCVMLIYNKARGNGGVK